MKSLLVVVAALGLVELALISVLSRVSDAYDKLTNRPVKSRRTPPWLRSLRGEREKSALQKYGVSAVERIGVISVVLCVLALEAWFFFSPRSALPY